MLPPRLALASCAVLLLHCGEDSLVERGEAIVSKPPLKALLPPRRGEPPANSSPRRWHFGRSAGEAESREDDAVSDIASSTAFSFVVAVVVDAKAGA
jgi:hypothetical protein